MTAAENDLSYPSFSIIGLINPPIAEAAATAEPDIAPNNIHDIILTNASPPGIDPNIDLAKAMSRSAIPPWFIN